MNKRFTLIELISVIVVLSILLSIVLLKVSDVRKQSIYSMVSSNTSILQTAVDEYYLKEEKYPIKNKLTISTPQIVDVKELVEKGYIKKDLDLSKVNSQLYWVDVFGRVWGATENPPNNVTVLKGKNNNSISFLTNNKNIIAYNIYEVSGDKLERLSYKDFDVQKPNERSALAAEKTKYQMVYSEEFKKSSAKAITYEGKNKDSIYLVSIIDDFGLESVPVGLRNNDFFSPLIEYTGTREYEVEGSKTMYWIDFVTVENKPAGTDISYKFKIKGEDGEYGDWTNDYFSLGPSKGIIVQVSMTSEDKKVKPSLYDLQVIYHFGDTPGETLVDPDIVPPVGLDPITPLGETSSSPAGTDGNGNGNENGGSNGEGSDEGNDADNGSDTGGDNGGDGNSDDSDGSNGNGNGSSGKGATETCPAGYNQSTFKSDGKTVDGSGNGSLSFLFNLPEGHMMEQLINPNVFGGIINSISIQYAEEGSNFGYKPATSLFEAPLGSCVNIVYDIDDSGKGISLGSKPIAKTSEETKHKIIDGNNNDFIPVEEDEETEEEDWTTIDGIRFTANSPTSEPVKWIDFEKKDYTPENTRILYWFTGSNTNGSSWTEPTLVLSELPMSKTAVVIAELQILTSEINNPEQEEPDVSRMKLIHAGGEVVYEKDKEGSQEPDPEESKEEIRFIASGGVISNSKNMFDGDLQSNAVVNLVNADSPLSIKWIFSQGYNPDVEGKAIKMRLLTEGTYDQSANTIKVFDEEGKVLDFYYKRSSDNKYSFGDGVNTSSALYDYYIVLPKNAAEIKILPTDNNSAPVYIYDVQFSNINTLPEPLSRVKIEAGHSSASMTWTKQSTVAMVDIYRDGFYIGSTKGTSFTDPATLVANTNYTYSFVLSDEYFNAIYQTDDSFTVTTAGGKDINFDAIGTQVISKGNMFDGNVSNSGTAFLNEDGLSVTWKVRSGYHPDLVGKSLKVDISSGTAGATLKVLDKDSKELTFFLKKSTEAKFTKSNSIAINSTKSSYHIALPEGAESIHFSPPAGKTVLLTVYDISLGDPVTIPSELGNLTIEPSYSSATITWTRPSNFYRVTIFRDGVYVGDTNLTSFTDNRLIPNKEYVYSFVVASPTQNIIEQNNIKVKTLERNISIQATGPNVGTGVLTNMYDDDMTTYNDFTSITNTKPVMLNWTVKEGYNPDITGKILNLRAHTGFYKEVNYLKVLDKNGKELTFYYKIGYTPAMSTSMQIAATTSPSDYQITLPAGADRIVIAPKNSTTTTLSIYDARFQD